MNAFLKKHVVLRAVGPLVISILLVAVIFLSPLTLHVNYSSRQLKEFAKDPKSRMAFIGYSVKSKAYQEKNFLPILGSSELEHVDSFHPSVWSEKYHTKWTPFLAGMPGTASLSQFFYVNSVQHQLKNRKMVFIISPQWFNPNGAPVLALEDYISKGEIYNWLVNANPQDASTQALAKRLLAIPNFADNSIISASLQNLAKKQEITTAERIYIKNAQSFWKKEDLLFSYFDKHVLLKASEINKIDKYKKILPDVKSSDNQKLDEIAYELGKKASDNNPFEINNDVWNRHQDILKGMKDKQQNVSYLQSPEYNDFQQLLNQFAKNKDDVLFVIQPVNGKFDSYTGLPYSSLKSFSDKITYQLRSQGFNNIDDMTDKYFEPYYSGDTIHFGSRGWLNVDRAIDKFMKTKNKVNYKINNDKFLSNEWSKDQNF